MPKGYAIYFQKAYSTYALFFKGKRVAGTVTHVMHHGGHEGLWASFGPARTIFKYH